MGLGKVARMHSIRAFLYCAVPAALLAGCDVMEPVPVEPAVVELSAGAVHTCALTTVGEVFCWGGGASGQLGRGNLDGGPRPAAVQGGRTYSAIAAGGRHTCALSADGAAWCWGANDRGQSGVGGPAVSLAVPTRVASEERFVAISAGEEHTCALTAAGAAWCWGAGADGRLGTGASADAATPTAVATAVPFAHIAAGGQHTCALAANGELYCWGDNETGQLGTGEAGGFSAVPVPAESVVTFTSLAAGSSHACAVATGGRVHCWGRNARGEVGTWGDVEVVPVPMVNEELFSQVSAGTHLSCGVRPNGEMMCWGRGTAGELGNGAFGDAISAQLVMHQPGVPFGPSFGFYNAVAVGEAHACALVFASRVACWGRGDDGQLGNGVRLTPVPLPVRLLGS